MNPAYYFKIKTQSTVTHCGVVMILFQKEMDNFLDKLHTRGFAPYLELYIKTTK